MSRSEQQLRDEIALRQASIDDARRELAAGELSTGEALAIETRERTALEATKTALGALSAEVSAPRSMRRRRRWLLVSALSCFLAAALVLLWSSLSTRQPGNSITGSVSLSRAQHITQLLNQAETDTANGNVVAALSAYQEVLVLSPRNVAALTQSGWLDFSAGSAKHDATLVALGVSELRLALASAPRNPAPRLYYAIVADSTPGNRALAIREFDVFLTLKPSNGQLAVARPFLRQLGINVA